MVPLLDGLNMQQQKLASITVCSSSAKLLIYLIFNKIICVICWFWGEDVNYGRSLPWLINRGQPQVNVELSRVQSPDINAGTFQGAVCRKATYRERLTKETH